MADFLTCGDFITYFDINLIQIRVKRKIQPVTYQNDAVTALTHD